MLRPLEARRCPVDQALEVLAGKWKPLILWRLAEGALRYNELMRSMPGVTQRMLTLQLRELERDGLLRRVAFDEPRLRVEYSLTEPARRLLPHLHALGNWLLENHDGLVDGSAAARDASDPMAQHSLVHRI